MTEKEQLYSKDKCVYYGLALTKRPFTTEQFPGSLSGFFVYLVSISENLSCKNYVK